jgi:hypothetical protein
MKTYIAQCFQSLSGRYLSLEENNKSTVRIKATNEEEAFERLSEQQQEDSHLRIEERWSIYEVTEESFNSRSCPII